MSSDYLFARPSFAKGASRIINLWGTPEPYNWSVSGEEADQMALYADWSDVGEDLSTAMKKLGSRIRSDDRQMDLFENGTAE